MKARVTWKEKMQLIGEAGNHTIALDTKRPLGDDSGLTPKELVAIGVCGCTAMDVVALLKKHQQPLESLDVRVDVTSTEGVHPAVFKQLDLTFDLTGDVSPEQVLSAVQLSQSKYCGVSAMLASSMPIQYKVILNGQEIGTGKASF